MDVDLQACEEVQADSVFEGVGLMLGVRWYWPA